MWLALVPHTRGAIRVGRDLMGGFGMEVGPRLCYPPTRVALLATMAVRAGHPTRVWDEGVQGPAPLEDPQGQPWELVLAQVGLPTWRADLERARHVARGATQLVLWGGPLRAREREILAAAPGALGIVGEEESTWAAFLGAARAVGGSPPAGFAVHDGEALERGPEVEPLADLGTLPIPDRGLLENSRYHLPDAPGPLATMTVSKGCSFDCAFCGYVLNEGRRMRWRPLDQVLAEWRELPDHGIARVVFRDPLFTASRARSLELVRGIAALDSGIRWQCETAPRCLDEELVAAMARSGCEHISLGIETASDELQKAFCGGKLVPREAVAELLGHMRRHGIASRGFFMMGFPGESRAQMRATARLACELAPDSAQFCAVTPYPGTRIERADGLEASAAWDARHAGGGNGILGAGEIDAELRRAYMRFYLRPSRALRELARPRRLWGRLRRACALFRRSR